MPDEWLLPLPSPITKALHGQRPQRRRQAPRSPGPEPEPAADTPKRYRVWPKQRGRCFAPHSRVQPRPASLRGEGLRTWPHAGSDAEVRTEPRGPDKAGFGILTGSPAFTRTHNGETAAFASCELPPGSETPDGSPSGPRPVPRNVQRRWNADPEGAAFQDRLIAESRDSTRDSHAHRCTGGQILASSSAMSVPARPRISRVALILAIPHSRPNHPAFGLPRRITCDGPARNGSACICTVIQLFSSHRRRTVSEAQWDHPIVATSTRTRATWHEAEPELYSGRLRFQRWSDRESGAGERAGRSERHIGCFA